MMHHTKTKKQDEIMFLDGEESELEKIKKWRDSAFHAAVEKLTEMHGNPETVMQTGEAFGRGLFSQRLQEKSPDWTMKEWLELTKENVLKPLGNEFTFTKISPDIATTFMNRNPLKRKSEENEIASLFTYGVMRGLFLSAFPKGELLLKQENMADHPEFIFKTFASFQDKFERERVKRMFSTEKKDNDL
jgi:hypothetical protein